MVFPFIRCLTNHRKVQQPLVKLFCHLFGVPAGDVIPQSGVGQFKRSDLPRKVTYLIGFRQAEIEFAACQFVQR